MNTLQQCFLVIIGQSSVQHTQDHSNGNSCSKSHTLKIIFQLGNNHTHLAFHLWEGDLDCCDCDVAGVVVPEGDEDDEENEDDEDGDDNHGDHDNERGVSLWRLLNLLLDNVGALLGHSDVSEGLDYNYRVHLGGAVLNF